MLGSSGFIGQNLVCILSKKFKVLALDIRAVESPKNEQFIKTDMTDSSSVMSALRDVDVVFHLATSSLLHSLESPALNMRYNIEGTLNVLEAARKIGVAKIVYSSASSVYGEVRRNPVPESHPLMPKTPYAVSKLACEHYVRVYQEMYGLSYVTYRFFNIYGPGQYPESGGLIPSVFKKLLSGEKIDLYGSGGQTRDFTFVDDVAMVLARTVEKDIKNVTLNLGTGVETPIKNVIETCAKIVGVSPKFNYLPERKGEISNFSADTRLLVKLFGTIPFTPLEKGLRATYEWLRHQLATAKKPSHA